MSTLRGGTRSGVSASEATTKPVKPTAAKISTRKTADILFIL
jgi:hypothetical protein